MAKINRSGGRVLGSVGGAAVPDLELMAKKGYQN